MDRPRRPFRSFHKCRTSDPFRRITQVGKGTFGEVWQAEDTTAGSRVVALKRILLDAQHDRDGFPVTALREIKLLKRLCHPNVISLIEIVVSPKDRSTVYMVFEFAAHDLAGLLRSGALLRPRHVMCLAKQLLQGLHYIHSAKILHRDLKAANLLISAEGVLKIGDFGLARFCQPDKALHYTGLVCTRWYRPPEVLLGHSNYTSALDMWGVGCIIAEMFVGEPILKGGVKGCKDDRENDIHQFLITCELCGNPSAAEWPDFDRSPNMAIVPKKPHTRQVKEQIQARFRAGSTRAAKGAEEGLDLIDGLLTWNPAQRLSCAEALEHAFFFADPSPCLPSELPLPAASQHEYTARPKAKSAKASERATPPPPPPQGHRGRGGGGGGGMPAWDHEPRRRSDAGSRRSGQPQPPHRDRKRRGDHEHGTPGRDGGSRPDKRRRDQQYSQR